MAPYSQLLSHTVWKLWAKIFHTDGSTESGCTSVRYGLYTNGLYEWCADKIEGGGEGCFSPQNQFRWWKRISGRCCRKPINFPSVNKGKSCSQKILFWVISSKQFQPYWTVCQKTTRFYASQYCIVLRLLQFRTVQWISQVNAFTAKDDENKQNYALFLLACMGCCCIFLPKLIPNNGSSIIWFCGKL
jgi:hypothetical protein